MIAQLESIVIRNSRCINGTITIPLNAPVVLLHGPNGTGKTSVLSAIELALTGKVSALQRFDADYLSHVVNRGKTMARITLTASGLSSKQEDDTTITIRTGNLSGAPL